MLPTILLGLLVLPHVSYALLIERSGIGASSAIIPPYMPQDLMKYYDEALAEEKRMKLANAVNSDAKPTQVFDYERCHRSDTNPRAKQCLHSGKENVFEAVDISFDLIHIFPNNRAGYVDRHGSGQGKKNIVKMSPGEKDCIVYGMGISGNSRFEEGMAENGCKVHAFDCTVSPTSEAVVNKSFTFHQTCIGKKQDFSKSSYAAGQNDEAFQFKTLHETEKDLGHEKLDILKFDIEGFEWQLFEDDIFNTVQLPVQMAFELHTEESKNTYVPEGNVKGKGYHEVSRLFLKLYDMGYRVISKQINGGDPACAEFVLINIDELRK